MIPVTRTSISRFLATGTRCSLAARVQQRASFQVPRPTIRFLSSYSHDAPSASLLAEAKQLMATQHSHRHGPWLSIATAVQAHYQDHCSKFGGHDDSCAYKVLDLACGPRGEPATTIARALPNARVHCTDLCELSIAEVPVANSGSAIANANSYDSQLPPPNLTKSVASLTDLSSFPAESFNAITCCYGYNLIDDAEFEQALKEAYRVLAPGGALIVANWESSALHFIGRDVLSGVQQGHGYDGGYDDNDSLFLPRPHHEPIALSSGTESAQSFREAIQRVGFLLDPVSLIQSYPFRLGRLPALQFFIGTFTIRDKLMQLGALVVDKYAAGAWSCLAEQIFFSSIGKYSVPTKEDESESLDNDGTMWLHGNTYKMSIMRK